MSVLVVCIMEGYESDQSDIILTQTSSKEFEDVPSSCYGGDIVDSNTEVVSLEANCNANFNILSGYEELNTQRHILYDNVEIEDISSDEEIDKM